MKKLTEKCKLAIELSIATCLTHDRPTMSENVFDTVVADLCSRHIKYIAAHNAANPNDSMKAVTISSQDRMIRTTINLEYVKSETCTRIPRMQVFAFANEQPAREQEQSPEIKEATEYLTDMQKFYNFLQ